MNGEKTQNGKRIVCGVAVGLANSLFGGGGGMLAVPILEKTGLSPKRAHATAILVILPISLLSLALYLFRGLYDFSVFVPTALGVTAGGELGAALLGKLPTKTVNAVFAVLQAVAGVCLLFLNG
ncbi:MAG: sulfite exporter TauE/SafE family protein [Clostridia bacterium]|nr:sulfite exporter TauE/SafE family protein [Clostridia bacterium]